MMSYDFTSTAHSKWILVGEHAVVRGHAALVFPMVSKNMTLAYQATSTAITATFDNPCQAIARTLFWRALEEGLKLVDHSINQVSGHFTLANTIPIGAGLGASAALCLNIARWLCWKFHLTRNIVTIAQHLEHCFHGISSGLDIVGAMHHSGMYFQQQQFSPIIQTWQPYWYLSYAGTSASTASCVNKVLTLCKQQPLLGVHLDQQMQHSVELAIAALQDNSPAGLNLLARAINQAGDCFKQWGLTAGTIEPHLHELLEDGALAVKPTGSGSGGYILSLWRNRPTGKMSQKLLNVAAVPQ